MPTFGQANKRDVQLSFLREAQTKRERGELARAAARSILAEQADADDKAARAPTPRALSYHEQVIRTAELEWESAYLAYCAATKRDDPEPWITAACAQYDTGEPLATLLARVHERWTRMQELRAQLR